MREGRAVVQRLVAAGQPHYIALESADALADDGVELTGVPRVRAHVYTFEWAAGAKRFAVLWRNILLEWERAAVLAREGAATSKDLAVLARASRERLVRAAHHWTEETATDLAALVKDRALLASRLYDYSLQTNPWPTYREQLARIDDQLERLHRDYATRLSSAATFVKLADGPRSGAGPPGRRLPAAARLGRGRDRRRRRRRGRPAG